MDPRIIRLIMSALSGRQDAADRRELESWLAQDPANRAFYDRFRQDTSFRSRWEQRGRIDVGRAIAAFDRRSSGRPRRLFRPFFLAAAAAALLLSVAAVLFWQPREESGESLAEAGINPGSAKAVLVLGNGERIPLVAADTLRMASGGASIENLDDRLVYAEQKQSARKEYNELHVPRGGEYRLELSDGTRVRLNANSTLRYPAVFSGECRDVEFKGEAYFEVARSSIPFRVRTKGMQIQVYGTSFNLNTHLKDRIQAALVEGRIGIRTVGSAGEHAVAPSQLAEFDVRTRSLSVRDADLTPYLAWTRGLFIFDNITLGEIMESLGRWYDVDVFFANPELQDLHFTGVVKRYDEIGTILSALSRGVDVRFNRNGRTLTIYR